MVSELMINLLYTNVKGLALKKKIVGIFKCEDSYFIGILFLW